jgi:hypothetical protein
MTSPFTGALIFTVPPATTTEFTGALMLTMLPAAKTSSAIGVSIEIVSPEKVLNACPAEESRIRAIKTSIIFAYFITFTRI